MQILIKNLAQIVINYKTFTQILNNLNNYLEKLWENFAKIMTKVNEILLKIWEN